jgi:hypothetical protein
MSDEVQVVTTGSIGNAAKTLTGKGNDFAQDGTFIHANSNGKFISVSDTILSGVFHFSGDEPAYNFLTGATEVTTVNLPKLTDDLSGRLYYFSCRNTSNAVTVQPASGDTIDGLAESAALTLVEMTMVGLVGTHGTDSDLQGDWHFVSSAVFGS